MYSRVSYGELCETWYGRGRARSACQADEEDASSSSHAPEHTPAANPISLDAAGGGGVALDAGIDELDMLLMMSSDETKTRVVGSEEEVEGGGFGERFSGGRPIWRGRDEGRKIRLWLAGANRVPSSALSLECCCEVRCRRRWPFERSGQEGSLDELELNFGGFGRQAEQALICAYTTEVTRLLSARGKMK